MADEKKHDHLGLSEKSSVQKILKDSGSKEDNSNEKEIILFSDTVTKVNRKAIDQDRALLLTNFAVYNLDNKKYKLKRRISIRTVASITISTSSHEFVLHIPEEYDYRFKSKKNNEIAKIIQETYKDYAQKNNLKQKEITVSEVEDESLEKLVLTKPMSKHLTKEDIIQRKKNFCHDTDSDFEEDKKDDDLVKETTSIVIDDNCAKGSIEMTEQTNVEEKSEPAEKVTSGLEIPDEERERASSTGSVG